MAVLPPPGPGCTSCAARDAVIAEQARVLEEQAAVIAEQARVLEEQAAVIAEQARVLEEQAAAIGELRAGVVALAAEVGDLRRRLGRNSGNSSMAPSADDLPGRKPPPAKPKRGDRKRAVRGKSVDLGG